ERRPAEPLVRSASFAAARRSLALRWRAAWRVCRERDWCEADERGSRRSAPRTARCRRADGLCRRGPAEMCLRLPLGAGTFTPARRALESPMAIACFEERAPCRPPRTWWISFLTNLPARVVALFGIAAPPRG